MLDYQGEQRLKAEGAETPAHKIAKIGAVFSDGVTLVFPGASAASVKHYPANKDVKFSAGQLVLLVKASGTYVAVCRI